ncbi:MAG: hypothetical protein Q9195_002548 [Heterodermia aff. obscurata]
MAEIQVFGLAHSSRDPFGLLHLSSTTYKTPLIAATAIAGFFADRASSRQATFLTGLALTFAATILFAISKAPGLLVLARCLQGASAGIVYTVGLALLIDTVGRESLGQWMGFVMIGFNIGLLLGPMLGGVIYTKLGYWPVFVAVLAVVGSDLLLRVFMIEKGKAAKWDKAESSQRPVTYGSIITGNGQEHPSEVTEVARKVHSSSEAEPEQNSGRASLLSQDSTRTVASRTNSYKEAGFLASRFPIMVTLLNSKRLMSAVYGSFINTSLTCAFDSVLPLFVKKTFGWDATAAGLIFLTIAFPSILGPLAGAMADRFGPRPMALSGFVVTSPALALLALVRDGSVKMQALLCVLLTIVGIGNSAVYAPLGADMSATIDSITEAEPHLFATGGGYAQAFSLFDAAIALGTIFGPVLAGFTYHVGKSKSVEGKFNPRSGFASSAVSQTEPASSQ